MGIAGTWLVPFEAMRNLMTATAIVSTVVLLWYGWPGFRRALHGMTFFGRMSLTNYLLQSLLGTALFYNWGPCVWRRSQRRQKRYCTRMIPTPASVP